VSLEERNAWMMLVVAVGGLVVYLTLVLAAADGGPLTDVRYQPLLLWVIGVSIAIGIVGGIINGIRVNLAGERETDERDREIARFSTNVGQAFLVIGGLAALLMAMAEWDWFWIANTLYLGFALSGILEGTTKVVSYRRGLPW
jgi:MFS family permease